MAEKPSPAWLLGDWIPWPQGFSAAGFSPSFNLAFVSETFFYQPPPESNSPIALSRNTAERAGRMDVSPSWLTFLWFPLVSASPSLWVSVSVIKLSLSSPSVFRLFPFIAVSPLSFSTYPVFSFMWIWMPPKIYQGNSQAILFYCCFTSKSNIVFYKYTSLKAPYSKCTLSHHCLSVSSSQSFITCASWLSILKLTLQWLIGAWVWTLCPASSSSTALQKCPFHTEVGGVWCLIKLHILKIWSLFKDITRLTITR